MKLYFYDLSGWLTGKGKAEESPLEPGSFIIPPNTTQIAPPEFDNKKELPQFNGSVWSILENPVVTADKLQKAADKKIRDDAKAADDARVATYTYKEKRAAEYPAIGDQLDALYKARSGDTTDLTAIDAKITVIKAKYPKPGQAQ